MSASETTFARWRKAARAARDLSPLYYRPIPGMREGSQAALNIKPPGTWFGEPGYHVFIGGCGVGVEPTQQKAERVLLREALRYCTRQIEDAQKVIAHYEKARAALELHGVQKEMDGV